jgi:hypothetical protein
MAMIPLISPARYDGNSLNDALYSESIRSQFHKYREDFMEMTTFKLHFFIYIE